MKNGSNVWTWNFTANNKRLIWIPSIILAFFRIVNLSKDRIYLFVGVSSRVLRDLSPRQGPRTSTPRGDTPSSPVPRTSLSISYPSPHHIQPTLPNKYTLIPNIDKNPLRIPLVTAARSISVMNILIRTKRGKTVKFWQVYCIFFRIFQFHTYLNCQIVTSLFANFRPISNWTQNFALKFTVFISKIVENWS